MIIMAFDRAKHIKYWRMCANVLPDHYISSDASRVFLGFFIVAGLDLLDVLRPNPDNDDNNNNKPIVSPTERQAWIDWIYSCQTPAGAGFRGFTGTNLDVYQNTSNSHWDPGNLPNTFFALAALLILGDDLSHVKRRELLAWLPKLQRPDGSFGEILGFNDKIEGGRDLRYCCCAAGIAYILDPSLESNQERTPSFDEQKLVSYILDCQDYSGGFGESPLREPHSGLNYCAIATLELMRRLGGSAGERARVVLERSEGCRRWMIQRQTDVLYEDDSEAEEDEEEEDEHKNNNSNNTEHVASNPSDPIQIVGFNGRPNKIADTCYCFWNAGALSLLDSLHLADLDAVRKYLLEKTQHRVGGFGKGPDSPPDVMHSYLGLAALALYGRDGVKEIDPALCISRDAAKRIHEIARRRRGG